MTTSSASGMMVSGLFFALLVAACASSSVKPAIVAEPAPPSPTLEAPAALDFQPDTGIRQWLVAAGFPAVSADGSLVAIDARDDDGARGYDNMSVVVRRVDDDAVVFEQSILSADEQDQLFEGPPEALRALLVSRVAVAREYLARHQWVSMTTRLAYLGDEEPNTIDPGPSGPYGLRGDPGALEVRFDEPTLTVRHGESVVSWRKPEWSAATVNRCDPDDPESRDDPTCVCHNPAHVRQGWVDVERAVLLVVVGYFGHDACWEPDRVEHALRLPAATP